VLVRLSKHRKKKSLTGLLFTVLGTTRLLSCARRSTGKGEPQGQAPFPGPPSVCDMYENWRESTAMNALCMICMMDIHCIRSIIINSTWCGCVVAEELVFFLCWPFLRSSFRIKMMPPWHLFYSLSKWIKENMTCAESITFGCIFLWCWRRKQIVHWRQEK